MVEPDLKDLDACIAFAKRIYAWPDHIAETDFSPDVPFEYGAMSVASGAVDCLSRYRTALVFACSEVKPTNWLFEMIDSKRVFVCDKEAYDREFGRVVYDLTHGKRELVAA